MRKFWFEHVRKTRKKISKGKKQAATHREAMAAASLTWPKEKAKIERRLKREAKAAAKDKANGAAEKKENNN